MKDFFGNNSVIFYFREKLYSDSTISISYIWNDLIYVYADKRDSTIEN